LCERRYTTPLTAQSPSFRLKGGIIIPCAQIVKVAEVELFAGEEEGGGGGSAYELAENQ
jgi:hypothetical protein